MLLESGIEIVKGIDEKHKQQNIEFRLQNKIIGGVFRDKESGELNMFIRMEYVAAEEISEPSFLANDFLAAIQKAKEMLSTSDKT